MIGTVRRWWREPDHYYWITAILAARGAQNEVCRLIAVLTLGLGCLPAVMIWSPAGPNNIYSKMIALVVGVCSAAVAAYWARRRWPTRGQSLAFAGLVTASIVAMSFTHTNPVSGFVTGCSLVAIAAYLVFFHTSRYLLVMVVVVLGTMAVPVARLGLAGDVVWGLYLLITATVVIAAVSFVSQALVHLLGIAAPNTDIERVTGLLNREAFYETTGAFIASRSRLDDRYLVIVMVNLDNYALLTDSQGTVAGERARVMVGQVLRETTRHNAIVAHVADAEFLVADSFMSSDSSPLVERIRGAVRATPLRMTASIGVVSTPMRDLASCPPYDLLDELVALATTAMYEARRAGGNQAHYVACPRPAALDDYPGQAEDAS